MQVRIEQHSVEMSVRDEVQCLLLGADRLGHACPCFLEHAHDVQADKRLVLDHENMLVGEWQMGTRGTLELLAGKDDCELILFDGDCVVSNAGSGSEIFHVTPLASATISALPPSLLALWSINVVPKPRPDEAFTGGPPRSTHCRFKVSLLHVHVTAIEPAAPLSAPYLMELVPNSCSIMAR